MIQAKLYDGDTFICEVSVPNLDAVASIISFTALCKFHCILDCNFITVENEKN